MAKILTPGGTRWWLYWALTIAAFLLVTLPHLGFWPTLFQDEMQIIDYGRVFLDPDTRWSMGWLVHESMAMRPTFYIGAVLQELAFNLFSPAHFGARLSSITGAVLASAVIFGWLRCRDTPAYVAFTLSLVFLLEPMFNESYRQGRVDSWAIFVCVAACWLLRSTSVFPKAHNRTRIKFVIAGGLTGISVFVWPTSAALAPLILLELLIAVRTLARVDPEPERRGWLTALLMFSVGGLVCAGLCLIPFLANFEASWISLAKSATAQKIGAATQFSIPGMYVIRSPWLLPALLLSIVLKREWGLLIALSIAILMMFQTMIYPSRIIYLLPYLIAIIAGAATSVSTLSYTTRRKFWLAVAVVFMLGGNLWTSAVQRPLLAAQEAEKRSVQRLQQYFGETIGNGPYRVVTAEWDIYFAARTLGWAVYLPFGKIDKGSSEYEEFLLTMDYAILRESDTWRKKVKIEEVERVGFTEHSRASFFAAPSTQGSGQPGGEAPSRQASIFADIIVYRNPAME